ncbi:N-acetylglucosamine-6-phosphate deacetylase [Antrihabitans cavernicola]|uniref:Amidohydrolase family protein n=1 Tax=Antrihabitans cavernicola TaxID=2495913 RepID=A0A5A7S8K2_9NOCA|nr:amidohydrolase family protein [Spelaeibacter cavernicola]KAA0022256.1 amidohydrolase family protein [Spelaeibacter cavernicola]
MSFEIRGRIVTPHRLIDDGVLTVSDTAITGVLSTTEWCIENPGTAVPKHSGTVLPGLVDVHCHGGGGYSFTTTDSAEATAAARHHHVRGTTTLLGSLVTAPAATLLDQVAVLQPLVTDGLLAGIHLEGPFLSHARCGAQDPRYLIEPDVGFTEQLLDVGGTAIRVMTLAPELPGYRDVADLLLQHGVSIALGHSDASYEVFLEALADAALVTHLANGMPPLHHRSGGPVAASLVAAAAESVVVELIADGSHIDTGFCAMVFAAAAGQVALITDAMSAAGMPDGAYVLGPQEVTVSSGVARLANGSIAGGTSHLLDVVARSVHESRVDLVDAVHAASATPAAAVGLGDVCGSLQPGRFADAVIVDDDLRLLRVLRRGTWIE